MYQLSSTCTHGGAHTAGMGTCAQLALALFNY